jgi:hypothetical protein
LTCQRKKAKRQDARASIGSSPRSPTSLWWSTGLAEKKNQKKPKNPPKNPHTLSLASLLNQPTLPKCRLLLPFPLTPLVRKHKEEEEKKKSKKKKSKKYFFPFFFFFALPTSTNTSQSNTLKKSHLFFSK